MPMTVSQFVAWKVRCEARAWNDMGHLALSINWIGQTPVDHLKLAENVRSLLYGKALNILVWYVTKEGAREFDSKFKSSRYTLRTGQTEVLIDVFWASDLV